MLHAWHVTIGEFLHIKFSLHVLATQHVMNTDDKMSRKLTEIVPYPIVGNA